MWTDIEHRHHAALWYAYGRMDAGERVEPEHFAAKYADRSRDYYEGRSSYLPSIEVAYREFQGEETSS